MKIRTLAAAASAAIIASCATGPVYAGSAKFCDEWSQMVLGFYANRIQGMDRATMEDMLQGQDKWSAPIQYAVRYAYEAPEQIKPQAYRSEIYKLCRDDEL